MSDISDALEQARRTWGPAGTTNASIDELRAAAGHVPPGRSLTELLSIDALVLIVEPKRATAHRGTINPELDIAVIARECEAAGASAISVVTEPHLSDGSLDDLRAARGACSLPLIARDFIVDVRQVYALREAGADALLLPAHIHGAVDDADDQRGAAAGSGERTDTLDAIVQAARGVGMEVVLSVRTEQDLALALATDVDALNIDNRGRDGNVDVERTFELLADVPVGWPVISESIEALDQIVQLHRAGVDALLLDEGHVDTGLTNALAVYADIVR